VIRRDARRRPATALRDVVVGARVKIIGRIAGVQQLLEAPLTLRKCAGYRIELQTLDERAPTFIADERTQDFIVCDDHGEQVLVRASVARVVYIRDVELQTGRAQPPAPLEAFLARHGRTSYAPSGRPLRYLAREAVLTLGDQVSVVGRAQRTLDPGGSHHSYREPPMRLEITATSDEPLYVVAASSRERPTTTAR
jgi:hypothetical protein